MHSIPSLKRVERPVPRREIDLLLECGSAAVAERSERIRSLVTAGVDWSSVTAEARRHEAAALLFRNLEIACPDLVPETVLARLRPLYHANLSRGIVLGQELARVMRLLERAGIPAIPFKGPTLAALAHGERPWLRQFKDLDVLVHAQDVLRARDVLLSSAYRELQPTRRREAHRLRVGHEVKLVRDDPRVLVEVHWRYAVASLALRLDTESLWDRLQPVAVADTTLHTLGTEDTILMLCLHGFKDGWQQLKPIFDLSDLIRASPRLDWVWLVAEAEASKTPRIVRIGLALARDLGRAALPASVEAWVASDSTALRLAGEVQENVLLGSDVPLGVVALGSFHIRARERWRDRARYLPFLLGAALTPNEKDRSFLRLPSSLEFLYPALRPFRLFGAYVLGPLLRRPRGRNPAAGPR